jgi:hypothetical protein
VRPEQVLGAFAHPSMNGGSQVDVYLGEKTADDLRPRDPVRARVRRLTDAAARMRRSIAALDRPTDHGVGVPAPAMVLTAAAEPAAAPMSVATPGARETTGLYAVKSRGGRAGTILRPHVQGGAYIVSTSRFEADYIRVPLDRPLEPWLTRGYRLRMSAPGDAPSLIAPASIKRLPPTT